jgi:hypothetical protein
MDRLFEPLARGAPGNSKLEASAAYQVSSRRSSAVACGSPSSFGSPLEGMHRLSGGPCRRQSWSGLLSLGTRFWFGVHNFDAALEVRAILNENAGSLDVAHQFGVFPDLDLLGGFHIAL